MFASTALALSSGFLISLKLLAGCNVICMREALSTEILYSVPTHYIFNKCKKNSNSAKKRQQRDTVVTQHLTVIPSVMQISQTNAIKIIILIFQFAGDSDSC